VATARRGWQRAGLQAALCVLLLLPCAYGQAGVLRYCDPPAALDAAQQDQLFRFAAVIKSELEASGHALALVARSGLDLGRFGRRLTHAGISLKDSANGPWSVRQLYYDCDLRQPRIFDQGVAGFLLGGADPSLSQVSVLLLPAAAEAPLARAAHDRRLALGLLGSTYSANAYPFAPRYQNCNQWVVEMLAVAWGALPEAPDQRAQAQRWLWAQGYEPTRFDVDNPALMWLAGRLPWLHTDDHPDDDLAQQRLLVSMPESIEAFVRARVPGARRIEFCHTERRVVVHHGWTAIAEGCRPGPQDSVFALD
jgi:hypothetical protein